MTRRHPIIFRLRTLPWKRMAGVALASLAVVLLVLWDYTRLGAPAQSSHPLDWLLPLSIWLGFGWAIWPYWARHKILKRLSLSAATATILLALWFPMTALIGAYWFVWIATRF